MVRPANIFRLLRADHDKQRRLLNSIFDNTVVERERWRLFEEFCEELRMHAAAEEQTLYAELLGQAQHEIQQSVAANDEMAELMLRLYELDPAAREWRATFETLKEKVESHLDLEEQQLFPRARKLIKWNRARWLAERFEQVKEQERALDGGDPSGRSSPDLQHPAALEPQDWPALARAAMSAKG